jgi:hypothetical protein
MYLPAPQKTDQHRAVNIAFVGKCLRTAFDTSFSADPDIFQIFSVEKASVQCFLIAISVMMGILRIITDVGVCL